MSPARPWPDRGRSLPVPSGYQCIRNRRRCQGVPRQETTGRLLPILTDVLPSNWIMPRTSGILSGTMRKRRLFGFRDCPRRWLAIVLAVGLVGCKDSEPTGQGGGDKKEITPALYWELPPKRQAAIRTTKIYIPEGIGFADDAVTKGPWASTFERMVHQCEINYFVWQTARTMFEFEHPTVMLEGIAFDMWSGDLKAILGASLHSRRSPAMYIARSLPESMVDGWYADITDYLDDWPQARDHQITKALGTFDERIYCLADNTIRWPVIAYRRDYFAQAGITNEFGEPGPPSNWTWSDFRKYAKTLTKDTDGDGKIDRWGFVAEQHRFDLYYSYCNGLEYRLYVPDKSGQYVWRFNPADPKLLAGIKKFREMYWVDRSVLTGVHYTWLVKEREFSSDKVAMAMVGSGHPPEWALTKPFMFGGKINTIDILGMAPVPRADPVPPDAEGFLYREAGCNMFGFNPLYSPEQLKAAIGWFRSWVCGYYNFLYLSSMRHQNKAWGRPDPFPPYDLTKTYEPEVPLPSGKGREVYPKEWINVYDVHNALELFPTPQMFGLLKPAQLGDGLNNLFSELLFAKPKKRRADGSLDPEAEESLIRGILAVHTGKINARCMNARPADEDELRTLRDKMKRYYTALVDFAGRNLPPAAAAEVAEFVETECICW